MKQGGQPPLLIQKTPIDVTLFPSVLSIGTIIISYDLDQLFLYNLLQ